MTPNDHVRWFVVLRKPPLLRGDAHINVTDFRMMC